MDQGSNKNHSPINNFTPTITKFCVMWEGQALPHDTKFGNCRDKIVDSRAFLSWSLIHGSSWSRLIKAEPDLCHHMVSVSCVLLLRHDADASAAPNGNAAFKWKLRCHWLKHLHQHNVPIVGYNPGPQWVNCKFVVCAFAMGMPQSCTKPSSLAIRTQMFESNLSYDHVYHPVPLKQPWRILVNWSHEFSTNPRYNQDKTKPKQYTYISWDAMSDKKKYHGLLSMNDAFSRSTNKNLKTDEREKDK